MHKETPWTLKENNNSVKKQRSYSKKVSADLEETRKSHYAKNKESDTAISTARVLKFFELHKEKSFNTAQIATALDLSEGTISSIMNRLITLGDINVVTMQRPHWAPVYQHADSAIAKVEFTYKKEDSIISILNVFKKDVNAVYTKNELLKELGCSEGMLIKSIQILLLKGDISYVGSENGKAKYQHKDGNIQGIEVSCEPSKDYVKLSSYLKEKKLQNKYEDVKKILGNVKTRLFYSSTGLTTEYLKEDLNKAVEKMDKKKFLGLF